MRPPSSKGSYETLPEEKQARIEAAVDLFGQHLLSLRNQLFDRVRQTVESDETRELLPRLKRQEYEAVATLAPEVREVALELASKSVDLYIQSLSYCSRISARPWPWARITLFIIDSSGR